MYKCFVHYQVCLIMLMWQYIVTNLAVCHDQVGPKMMGHLTAIIIIYRQLS